MAADDMTAKLEAFLGRQSGATNVRVDNLKRLTGGASRQTWSLDATIGGEALPLILQHDTRSGPKQMTRALEFALLRAAFDSGVPAPEPLYLGDDSLGGEFFLVRRAEGETLPRRLLRDDEWADARRALPAQLGATLAKVHAVPLDAPGLDGLQRPPDGLSPVADALERNEQIYRGMATEPHPAFELAFRWLRMHVPDDDGRRTLVHGDFRMGNVLFDHAGARLLLDWELAHVGDPAEDLAWACVRSWRFGGPLPVGGIGTREEYFAAYEAAGGAAIDPTRVHFWEVFGNLRWGIICITQARMFLDGHSTSVELASIGRRTAETEWELLELVG